MIRVLDGIDAFLDQLASVHPLPVLFAVLAQLAKLTCTSMAWRNVLAAAYPNEVVRRRSIVGAYLAGVGVNALVPLRAGDAVRVLLAHRAIGRSTYTTIVSSTLVLSIFDIAAASALLTWAALTQDALPGLGELPELPSFDFSWLLDHPLAAELLLAGLVIVAVAVGIWIHGHVLDFWDRVKQAFAVVRRPTLYLRTVAFWQAGDWILRLVAIWFLLDAFDIPQTPENVLLVQVSASIATLLPLTPAGIGTEQAFLLYMFQGAVPSSKLLAFSVGLKFMTVGTNVVAGFTAIALTLRTLRYKQALAPPEETEVSS
ncbi:MAG: flippase-like domain-containing protein [Thermoleophilia bacterium]|nr:flippase-like domain-containing protein [Thermoleophilia bacterium]MDH4340444.1 flippase-like domain-containing protein [Thermoleophilia bacterium]MDH5281548.1 flippase-like domain-containing protein [Thermoleophilia bacterium]